MTDLAQFDTRGGSNQGAEIELKDPRDGKTGLGVFIKVMGPDSHKFREALLLGARKRREAFMRDNRNESTPQEIEEGQAELFAALTLGWRDGDDPALQLDGERVEFSEAAARDFYLEYPRFRQQIDQFISSVANFMPRSGTT